MAPPSPTPPPIPVSVARPLTAAALFMLGLLGARALPHIPSWALLSLALLLALGAAFTRRRAALALTLLALSTPALAAGWLNLRLRETPRDFLAHALTPGEPSLLAVEGVVVTPPQVGPRARGPLAPWTFGDTVPRFDLAVPRILPTGAPPRAASATYHVRNDPGPVAPLPPSPHGGEGLRRGGPQASRVRGFVPADAAPRAGDLVRISGRALPVEPPANPGEPDWRLLAAQSRTIGTLLVPRAELVEPLDRAPSFSERVRSGWAALRAAARAHARAALAPALASADDSRGLLAALLLGDTEHDDRDTSDAFTRLGLVHLLSLSGLHLSLLAWAALLTLRALGLGSGRLEPLNVIALTLLYLLIIPVRAPALRAAIMVICLLAGEASGRRYHPLATLALAAVLCLLWRPLDLWTPGFQLSFGVVAALVAFTRPLDAALFPARTIDAPDLSWRALAARRTRLACVGAVVAWLVSTPVVAFHTGILSPLAPLATVLLAPLVTLLLGLGYVALALGALLPSVGVLAGPLLGGLAGALGALARLTNAIPGAAIVAAPITIPATLAGLLAVVWLLASPPRAWKSWRGAASAALLAWFAGACVRAPALPPNVALRIDMLGVGDGTCVLLRSGRDAILYDCGSDRTDMGRLALPRALRALGVRHVPTIVVSHADLDHYSAIPDMLRPLSVRRIVTTPDALAQAQRDPFGAFAYTLDAARRAGVEVSTLTEGGTIELSDLPLTALWPPSAPAADPRASDNQRSLALACDVPTGAWPVRLLLTGDLEGDALESLLVALPDARAAGLDILEAPHHGSARPEVIDFVRATDPRVVLQSTGPSRADDERWDAVRDGRLWWCTATDGAAWVEVRWDGAIRTGALRPLGGVVIPPQDPPPAQAPDRAPAPEPAPGARPESESAAAPPPARPRR